jgi:hypothetical protein
MRATTVTVGPIVAGTQTAVTQGQTATPGASMVINGTTAVNGVAILDNPRRIMTQCSGNDSLNSYTITGTGWNGLQTEVLQGANNGTSVSKLDWLTVTSIVSAGNTATTVYFGTSSTASSRWLRLDGWALNFVSIQATVSGTVNYTIETTMQDPNSPTNPVLPYQTSWIASPDPNVVGATTTQGSYFNNAPTFARVTLNSGSGSVSAVFTQSGVTPR